MRANWRTNALVVALVVAIAGGLLLANRSRQALGQEGKAPAAFPRYSVIVTDNQENASSTTTRWTRRRSRERS